MWRYSCLFTLFAFLTFSAQASNAPQAAQPGPRGQQPAHVWTNSDLPRLRAQDSLSIVGPVSGTPAQPQTAPAPPPAPQQPPAPATAPRVWTNRDIDRLRAQDSLSLIGPAPPQQPPSPPQAAPQPPAPQPPAARGPAYASPFENPAWYAKQAFELQLSIDIAKAQLAQAETNLQDAINLRAPFGDIHLGQFSILSGWPIATPAPAGWLGVTAQDGIRNLQGFLRNLEIKKALLADLARKNGIAPGVLRIR